jgi:hypothetical protein
LRNLKSNKPQSGKKERKMEKMNVAMMDAETLKETQHELIGKVEALPMRFPLNGFEFAWREKYNFDFVKDEKGEYQGVNSVSLSVFGTTKSSDRDLDIEIRLDGSVKNYSFHSVGGESNADAEKTISYYQTCCTLLSEEFRQAVIADYQAKAETLHSLRADYETISGEQKRRLDEAENEKKAGEAKKSNDLRERLEAVGQVWFDYRADSHSRYVVQSATEKTITFALWTYQENAWREQPYSKRISKHLLGEKPSRYFKNNAKIMVCPTGIADIQSQKAKRPETLDY